MQGFTRRPDLGRGRWSSGSSSALGLLYWGNRFKDLRRTTIILYGILGGGALVAAGLVLNHVGGSLPRRRPGRRARRPAFGLFVLAGATPAALGLLADISERFPNDRGAIMGLYSVFLAIGQIIGAIIGGFAAEARGHRRDAHRHGHPARRRPPPARPAAPRRGHPGDRRRCRCLTTTARVATAGRGRRSRWRAGDTARSSRRITWPRPRGCTSCALGGSAVDAAIATNAVLGVVMPSGCGIGGDAFWLIWDEARGEQTALNGSGRAPAAADAAGAARPRPDDDPAPRSACRSPCPGAVRSWGDAHARHGRLSRDEVLAPAIELARGRVPGLGRVRRGRRADRRGRGRGASGRTPASSRSTGRTAGRGDPASGSACRPWPRPSSGSPSRASTRSTTATWASARRAGWRRPARRSRAADLRGHTRDVGRAHRPRLPRHAGHDPPAEQLRASWPWSCSASCRASRRPDGDAFGPDGVTRRRLDPPRAGGREAGHGRPRRVPDRPDVPRRPGRAPARSGLPRRAGRGASTRRGPRRRPPATNPRGGGTIYLARGRRRGQRGQPHRVELPRLRVGRGRPGDRRPLPGPGQLLQPRPRRTPTSSSRASARSTRCSPGCSSGTGRTAGRGRGSSPGRWAATPSRRSTPSSCRPSSTAALDVRTAVAAPRWYVEPRDHFVPPTDVHLEPRHAPGIAEALAALGHDLVADGAVRRQPRPRARHRARRRRPGARRTAPSRPPPTRAAPACRPSGRSGAGRPTLCDTRRRPVAGSAHTTRSPAFVVPEREQGGSP